MSSVPSSPRPPPVPQDATGGVDLNRFSRQNAAYGAETTAKLSRMKVLIYGLRGVGAETSKNLVLQGVGGVTLFDNAAPTNADLGLNFFLTQEDVSAASPRSRAACFAPRLKELNPLCDVKVAEGSAFSAEMLDGHNALCVCNSSTSLSELQSLNELCRSRGVSFLYAFTGGLFSSVFVDHGDDHVVTDPDGERPVQKLVTGVTPLEGGDYLLRYETPEGQPPSAIDGGTFELQGFPPVRDGTLAELIHPPADPVKTVRIAAANAPAGIAEAAAAYVGGGILLEKKMPRKYPMHSFAHKVRNPGNPFTNDMVMSDLLTFAEQQIHVALIAVLSHAERSGLGLPTPASDSVAAVRAEARRLLASGDISLSDFEVDDGVCGKVAAHAAVELQPMAAFVGGVLAQEVVKVTGKFTPIPGWFHFHSFETLPSDEGVAAAKASGHPNFAPRNSRYDNLAAVFGWDFVEKLGNLKYFMVGCGALGCEFLKNFSLNGVCCGPEGKLIVTDADRIELSNLSRQFLFREHNVGQPKSRAAGVAAKKMNGDLKMEALEQFVGKNTENVFNDDFWMGLSGVCNALDNMEAREYVDKQCVKYDKSLLESGTMGTSGNVDTIYPLKTKTYRDGGKAAQGGGVPMCTLRNFPHLTDHCIEWSRDQFELLFVKIPKAAAKYLENPDHFERECRTLAEAEASQAIFEARCALAIMRAAGKPSVETAAQLSFDLFHLLFRDKIRDLQNAFPADSRMKDKAGNDTGPFWHGHKRYPTVAAFNPDDEAHWNFLTSATALFGVILGVFPQKTEGDDSWLAEYRDSSWAKSIAGKLESIPYLQAPVKTDADEEKAAAAVGNDAILDGLLAELRAASKGASLPSDLLTPEFEKDDDLNFHIAFVTAASNLRCDNYHIRRTDFHACKVIAGKIIAAIATTTAAVCGLVLIELLKVVQEKGTDDLMLRQIGLAVNNFTSFTQDPPKSFSTYTARAVPDAAELEGMDAYDEKGAVKEEFVTKTVKKSYPEKHSEWDKLVCEGSLTLDEFIAWMKLQHSVVVKKWDFVLGKSPEKAPVSIPVYPVPPVLDYSLLPSLDLTMQQATMAMMKNAAVPQALKQKYIGIWKESKASGAIPSAGGAAGADKGITGTTTLKEILTFVEAKGDEFMATGKVIEKNVSHIAERRFWLVPGSEAPSCETTDGDEIEHLAAIKIVL